MASMSARGAVYIEYRMTEHRILGDTAEKRSTGGELISHFDKMVAVRQVGR